MKKIISVSLALALVTGLATAFILYAYVPGYYGDENLKTDVKKIDKGIQITITSDDPEIVKDIQEDARWYTEMLRYGSRHCQRLYREWRGDYRRGCRY